jgi:selenide,water dikinase
MMHTPPLPLTHDIVLIGGGHAHALVLRNWGMNPLPGARLTVINPNPVAPYTGMLPGAIAGHYRQDEMMVDLVRLARFAGARIILDRATGLDRAAKRITLATGRSVRYDTASIDIGITSDLPDVPGFDRMAKAAKPLGNYAAAWETFVQTCPQSPRLVIIGAGVGGVELALASAHRLRSMGKTPQITLVQRGPDPVPGVAAATRRSLMQAMDRYGITLHTGTTATPVSATGVALSDGTHLPSDFTLSVAGANPHDWLKGTGLTLHEGFITVSPTLQTCDPALFAVGDCAHLAFAPRPKAGVFAVRQAPILLHNLRVAAAGKGEMRPFRPQRDYLKLASMGDKSAVADKFGLRTGGAWLWWLKDRIDQKFMAKFADYPAMPAPALPKAFAMGLPEALGDKPMCGGCGAKVGPQALADALTALPPPQRADVLSGRDDDAATLNIGGHLQMITTDHLRAFTGDPALMARLAAIHALGDIWAMGAAPQAALAQITLPRLSPTLQAEMLAEIMAAAASVFRAAGADIVGGHTSVGDELTIGFTATGLVGTPITKAGAAVGDAIVLTKPIGSGILLAAEMAATRITATGGPLLGEAWAACVASMSRPLDTAARTLAGHATAMTDVTGFGLAGHLWEMLQTSGHGAELSLASVPLLPGAEALAAMGAASTLAPANRAQLDWHIDAPPGPRTDLLFDPQTCGGLLVTLPPQQVRPMLAALHAAGDCAAMIGHIIKGPPRITAV